MFIEHPYFPEETASSEQIICPKLKKTSWHVINWRLLNCEDFLVIYLHLLLKQKFSTTYLAIIVRSFHAKKMTAVFRARVIYFWTTLILAVISCNELDPGFLCLLDLDSITGGIPQKADCKIEINLWGGLLGNALGINTLWKGRKKQNCQRRKVVCSAVTVECFNWCCKEFRRWNDFQMVLSWNRKPGP